MENCVGLSSCEEGEDEVLDVRIKVEIMHKHVECRYKTAATYTTLHCTVLHCTLHSAAVIWSVLISSKGCGSDSAPQRARSSDYYSHSN